jgi:hypothetical protein
VGLHRYFLFKSFPLVEEPFLISEFGHYLTYNVDCGRCLCTRNEFKSLAV